MSVSATVNGVDVEQLAGLRDRLARNPVEGDTTWRAEVTWKGGFVNEIRVRDLVPLRADEPTQLGGSNTAPNPVEQLLGALGSCLAIGYTANASVRGITVEELRIDLEGHIDLPVFLGLKDGNAGYPEVGVRVHLKAAAPPEVLRELHEHVLRTSPVGNTIQRSVGLKADLVTA
ncbi:MAG: OsmC family protein [Candidatus Dormibacteraeota bacterium]|nr:OsmC family protein [Candidatus Dormibacteraeota bacterium]